MTKTMATNFNEGIFRYRPAAFVPFQDLDAIQKARAIRKEDMDKHPNPEFIIKILPGAEIDFIWMMDIFHRIHESARNGEKLVLIMPQPCPLYRQVAALINRFSVNCSNLWTFNMDEYANEQDETPPDSWPQGFMHAMLDNFYYRIEPQLRPPREQVLGPTGKNINDYGKMLTDQGGADCCYSGPGWTGHLAFIEPDAPEFDADLNAWRAMGPRICTLSPFTIAQNSLHGAFGSSGDLAAVPPKAATIGPAEVIAAKNRLDFHAITVDGSFAAWQRLASRLCLHGPVTPKVPASILQTLRTDVYVSELIAEDVVPRWNKSY